MKTILTVALVITLLLLSCNRPSQTPDVDMDLLIDMTDKVKVFPNADEIIAPLNFRDHAYQGVRITVSTISDKDLNNTSVLVLEKEDEWTSNIILRRAKIQHFISRLQACLTAIQHSDTSGHSIIYRSIVAQANRLASSNAKRKYLIVFSNLYENSEVNFYSAATLKLLRNHPEIMKHQLERQATILALNGLDTWLIYNPSNYQDNNHYRPIVFFYEGLLQEHGSTIHVDTKFQPL